MIHPTRRSLLRAIAAGAGGAMLLPIMSRLTSAGPAKVARFLFIVEGNCYEPITVLDPKTLALINASTKSPITTGQRWWYDNYQHTKPLIVSQPQLDQTIALAPFQTAGIASQTNVVFGLSSRITGGGHTGLHGVLSSSRTVGAAPGGQTIDAHLAALAAVRLDTPYDAVRVGMVTPLSTARLSYTTCATAPGVPAPAIVDPLAAYTSLFGLVGTTAQQAEFTQRGGLLSYAKQDVQNALGAFSGSSDERAKLETYLASVEELNARQARLTMMATQLGAAKPGSPDADAAYATDCMDRFHAQLRLAVAAFKGQLTNVAVVTSGTGQDFGNLTYPSEPNPAYRTTMRHPLHHASAADPGSLQTIHDMTALQFSYVAEVAKDLMSTPDAAGGTMLDNTVIVFIADNGEQHHATASEFPVVLIGGQKLGLKAGGQTVVYPGVDTGGAGHRQVSNLWNTLGYLAGDQLDLFGAEGPFRVAPGPLSELMT